MCAIAAVGPAPCQCSAPGGTTRCRPRADFADRAAQLCTRPTPTQRRGLATDGCARGSRAGLEADPPRPDAWPGPAPSMMGSATPFGEPSAGIRRDARRTGWLISMMSPSRAAPRSCAGPAVRVDIGPDGMMFAMDAARMTSLPNMGEVLPLKPASSDRSRARFERALTFRQWNARSCRLANASWIGLRKGDRVAVARYNCIECWRSMPLRQRRGLVAVPITSPGR